LQCLCYRCRLKCQYVCSPVGIERFAYSRWVQWPHFMISPTMWYMYPLPVCTQYSILILHIPCILYS
jgi:hypothetical protein